MIVKKHLLLLFLVGCFSLEAFVEPEYAAIDQQSLLKHYTFFKKRAVVLSHVIKQVDAGLQYWAREKYTEHRTPWYRKSLYRSFAQKKYRKKVVESIACLQEIKKESARLLGLFSAYSDLYENHHQEEAYQIYQTIQSSFGSLDGLALYKNIINRCCFLSAVLEQSSAPKHIHAHWKSYATGAVSVAALACLYSKHKTVFDHGAKAVSDFCKDWWQENMLDNFKAARHWYHTGMTGEPLKILKDNPADEQGFIYIGEASEITGDDLPELRVVVDQDMPAVRFTSFIKFASRGDSAHLERQGLVNAYNNKFKPWFAAAREQLVLACQQTEHFVNQRKIKSAGKMLFAQSFEALLVSAGCVALLKSAYDYFYQKKMYMDPLRYQIKKLHQILHATYESNYEQHGLLRAHLQMMVEVTSLLPADVEQSLCEDVISLKSFLVPLKEKQKIVERWYQTYRFLRV